MENAANQIGDDLRGPPFDWPCYDNMACGDDAVEDDFLELLFLYVIEFRLAYCGLNPDYGVTIPEPAKPSKPKGSWLDRYRT